MGRVGSSVGDGNHGRREERWIRNPGFILVSWCTDCELARLSRSTETTEISSLLRGTGPKSQQP